MKLAEFNGQQFEFPDEADDAAIDGAVQEWAASNIPSYDDAVEDPAEWLSQIDSFIGRNQASPAAQQELTEQGNATVKGRRSTFNYDSYVSTLALHEGVSNHSAINQNGNLVRAYGVEVIPPGVVDNGDPVQLARDTAAWHVGDISGHLNKKYGVQFDSLPPSVQSMVTDLNYSTGKKFDSVNASIANGNYLAAAANSLSVVGLTLAGQKATTGGIAKRRADMFNMVADELGAERIAQVRVQSLGSNGTQYTYVGSSGAIISQFTTSRPLRSTQTDASGLRIFTL